MTGQTDDGMATPVQINANITCVSELFQTKLFESNTQTVFQSLFELNQGQQETECSTSQAKDCATLLFFFAGSTTLGGFWPH
jgi:hypothetical protein